MTWKKTSIRLALAAALAAPMAFAGCVTFDGCHISASLLATGNTSANIHCINGADLKAHNVLLRECAGGSYGVTWETDLTAGDIQIDVVDRHGNLVFHADPAQVEDQDVAVPFFATSLGPYRLHVVTVGLLTSGDYEVTASCS